MRVGLIGMERLPEPDIDEAPALCALRAAGIDAAVVHWGSGEPGHDPAGFDVCIVRAAWDYYRRPAEFLDWVRWAGTRTRLWNPPATIGWNLHKRYLLELAGAGIPIVPTALVGRGEEADLAAIAGERGWGEVVIKPAVSAASWKTRRSRVDGAGAAFLRAESAERDMLVQEYVPEVQEGAERALIWIGGGVTHGVTKRPRFAGSEEAVEGAEVTGALRSFAARVVGAAGRELLYARVDVIARADGSLQLSELELIEPSLYFPYSAEALARFVVAVRGLGSG